MRKPPSIALPCLLLRVSTDEQDMTQQEREAREYCRTTYGVELTESAVYREHGISGSKNSFEQRDALKRAVEACERGEYTHFIVHKLDRSARSVRVFAEVWDRLSRAGVAFVAIVEGIDSSRGDSPMTAQILSVVAEFYSHNLSIEIKKGKAGRIHRGKSNGKPPYGYRIEGNAWVPDTRELDGHPGESRVDVICRIFQEAAVGWSTAEIVYKLNRQGYIMESVDYGVGPWRRNSTRSLLSSRLYLGEVHDHPNGSRDRQSRGWRPGAHEAIIDEETFNCAQTQLAEHSLRPRTVPPSPRPWIFSGGILKCAECRDRGVSRTLSFHMSTPYPSQNTVYFSCANKARSHICQAPNVRENLIAAQLSDYLERWQVDSCLIDEAVARYRQQCETTDQNVVALEQRKKIQAHLTRLTEMYEWGHIERDEYLQRRTTLNGQLLSITVNEQQHMSEELLMQIAATMRHIKTAWDLANTKQKGEMVRMLFRAIWIRNKTIESVDPQPHYRVFFGEVL